MTAEILLESKTDKGHKFVPINSLWRVSVNQYHAIIASGALTDDDPIELLQGWLVQKMPKNPKHTVVTRLLFDLLSQLIPAGWFVSNQEPITTTDSEPEPDLAIVQGKPQDYLDHHPYPNEVNVVVEVSDATLNRDRTMKKRLYSAALIPIYWIVNVSDQQIEVYTQPSADLSEPDYQQKQTYRLADSAPVIVDGEQIGVIAVSDLFPKSE